MKNLFLKKVDILKEQGKSEKEIAQYFRMTTMEFRKLKAKTLKKEME